MSASGMTLADILSEKRVLVCVGSGGVGKTTTAAALALHGARMGRKALVCTIDPAKRLANSLGLSDLGHQEQRIPDDKLGGIVVPGGQLHAMMLDQKRAFDEMVARHATDPLRRERILQNRIYRQVSSSLTGSLEYAAMAKLQALEEQGQYDLIVLDTPPTTNALDFLDAPAKLIEAIDSPILEWFTRPGSAGRFSLKVLGKGGAFVLRRLARFVGSRFLDDVAEFLVEFNDVLGGFRTRAQEVFALLRAPRLAFMLVAAPDPLATDEAIYFYDRLRSSEMPVGGFVINRVHASRGPVPTAEAVAAHLGARPELATFAPDELTRGARALTENDRAFETLAQVDARQIERLRTHCGAGYPYQRVPFMDEDVYDLGGLSAVTRYLFEEASALRTRSSDSGG